MMEENKIILYKDEEGKVIYQDQELSEEGTRKKFFLVRQEGKRQVKREIDHYNLRCDFWRAISTRSSNASRICRKVTTKKRRRINDVYTTIYS